MQPKEATFQNETQQKLISFSKEQNNKLYNVFLGNNHAKSFSKAPG